MKKIILTTLATAGLSLGAMAQGSLSSLDAAPLYFGSGVGSEAASSTSLYTGSLTLEVFFSSAATANEVSAINALNGTAGGGAAALADLTGGTDGFSEVSLSSGTTVGSVSGAAVAGGQVSGFAATIDLSSTFAPSTVGDIALYFVTASGTASGAFVFSGTYGGSPLSVPPGTAYDLATSPGLAALSADNLALTSVPEPTTMALAGLGSLSLFLLRRKK